jgi:uncharacterized SAM-binding protein YcdF (DUF218 family)
MTTYQFLKLGLLPGTVGLLLVVASICLIALWFRRGTRAALIILSTITAVYVAISVPPLAIGLTRLVATGYNTPRTAAALSGVQAIVVLDGGTSRARLGRIELAAPSRQSAERALEALRVFRILGERPHVLITGGSYEPAGSMPEGGAIREFLVSSGVPPNRILLDTTSRNTRDHAAKVPTILRFLGDTSFALVTSAVHMRRAMRAFTEAGTRPVAAPAIADARPSSHWWPTSAGLDESAEALYEVFGFLFGR